mgnify:CR=1 FL=1|tara:strand:+ start:3000 stop:5483 length:2484 start_codon:yes stop_codon:yes gene_type:complete
MVLTASEKASLDLSEERLIGLSTAGSQKRTEINRILNKFEEGLRDEARLIPDAGKREAAMLEIKDKRKAAAKYIKEQLKASKPAESARQQEKGIETSTAPIMALNMYSGGSRITSSDLLGLEIKGSIDIRNPKADVIPILEAIIKGNAGEKFKANATKILEVLKDRLDVAEYKKFKININQYLGAVDVSKKDVRIKVYDYWAGIAQLYDQFEEDMTNFFIEVRDVDWPDEISNEFEKLYKRAGNINLEYIAKFENVTRRFESGYHRFFNIVAHRLALDRMTSKYDNQSGYADDKGMEGDVNASLLQYIEGSLAASSSTEGETTDMNLVDELEEKLQTQLRWEDDYELVLGAADPLLVYEYNRGTKLIAINDSMEGEILELLEDMLEQLEDSDESGKGVSLETTADVEEWLEQVADTQILEDSDVKMLALPISVLNNSKFSMLYSEDKFPSANEGESIGLDNLDQIKDFFNDLYDLLSSEDFRAEVEVRSTKGRRRGSVMETRESRGTDIGDAASGKIPLSLNQKGEVRDELSGFKQDLQKLLDSSIAYFFDPLYSGMMPIEIPNFSSSIGSKVIQTMSLDLGLETVMSGAYDTLFEGSREEIDAGDMAAIADFLDNIFMGEIKIDGELITDGEEFSDALTEIFGEGTRDKNDNYAAALIHHYMKETQDLQREDKEFNDTGKSIKERAKLFYDDYKARKPFPVFALPHWLDMNQGILTKGSQSKKNAYNRLKAIFESAQVDLPVLLHKLLKAHDAVRQQLGKKVIYGQIPMNDYGINKMITKLQEDENIDLTSFEVEQIIKTVDSHQNISREYGISGEQVYLIKASFR